MISPLQTHDAPSRNILRLHGASLPRSAFMPPCGAGTMHRSATKPASELAAQLRSLNFDARSWDESHAADPGALACDLIVADPIGLRLIAHCVGAKARLETRTARAPCRGGLAPRALRLVLAHIEMRLADRIELGDMAGIAGLSECHFSRAFRQSLGMPPHRYVLARRIAVAAGLVERTDQLFTDIAACVGFADRSHFTRMFVRMMGETPRAYRHRNR